MKIKTLIVDDEIMARKSMERLVQKHPDLEWVATCESGQEALTVMENSEIDLILLDVEMPGMTGFEFLDSLFVVPNIILTTTKENYAFDAFQYQVTDYLKKPITIPRFNTAIEKLVQLNKIKNQQINKAEENALNEEDIFLKVDSRLIRVHYKDILFIENVGDYAKVVTTSDPLIVHATMRNLEERLPATTFMRIHRSYIVNLLHIRDIEQNSIQVGGKLIPVSRAAKPDLLKRLNLL
ncbi:MAG: response regulator [Bacteroidetes bacterium]|nr:response regulator [Bacteroidota bacterium]